MRKKLLGFCFSCLLLSLAVFLGISDYGYAETGRSREEKYIEEVTVELFDKEIKSSEYLYGVNESADYVYVMMEEGYAVYHRATMELIEYAPMGELPYQDGLSRKYYGGPATYLYKDGNQFINITTEENYISDESMLGSSAPGIDTGPLIPATPPGAVGATYIQNAKFFLSNPKVGNNDHNTCGSVAAQLLLSYHNYYTDRRIIAPEHLWGEWKTSNNGNIFDSSNYNYAYRDPNACSNPLSMTSYTLGSNDDFYHHVMGEIEPGGLTCTDTIDAAGKPQHSHNGSTNTDVERGLEKVLSQRLDSNEYRSETSLALTPYIDPDRIKGEINSDRPVIIKMRQSLGGYNHWVVGYGYQDYTYSSPHPNAGETYSGYIVHFGWTSSEINIWVNQSWCDAYVSLQIKHEHNYSIDTGNIINKESREVRCVECGHRTVTDLYETNEDGDTIVGVNYPLVGNIELPDRINGINIVSIADETFSNQNILSISVPASIVNIGAGAFKDCTNLTSVKLYGVMTLGANVFSGCNLLSNITVSAGLTSIGAQAFNGCISLTSIALPAGLTNIGERAFNGCHNLAISVNVSNPNYSAEGNILYNKDKTKILAAGNIASEIQILNSVTEIAPFAFEGNDKLTVLHIVNAPIIGNYAFANCDNLASVYCYSYNVPTLGGSAFPVNNFTLYTPYNSQGQYNVSFVGYTSNIDSIEIGITFNSDGTIVDTATVYFGSSISGLTDPYKEGYDFCGWYENNDFTGKLYENGGLWDTTYNITVYAKWEPQQYYLSFNGWGSDGLSDKLVTYDSPIGELPILEREGYTFLGWAGQFGDYYTEDTIWQKLNNEILTADWYANDYTIYYDGNGGVPDSWIQNVQYDSVVELFVAVERAGYVFTGWNTLADGTGETVSTPLTYLYTNDLTLYAQYTPNTYSVTFMKLGGSGGSDGVDATYGLPMPEAIAPTRSGYTFQGYFAQPNGVGTKYYDSNMTSMANWDNADNSVIYAHWTANQYTVTLNKQSGTGGTSSVTVTFNSAMPSGSSISKPTRLGYTFQGYYILPNGVGVKYYNSDMSSANVWDYPGNATIYAYWTANQYTIILDKQSGNGGSDRVDATYLSAMPSAIAPTRVGYTFKGYFSQPNGKGTQYYNSDMSSANVWDGTENTTIYAFWQGIQYQVTLNSGGYGGTSKVTVTYGAAMPTAGVVAPTRTGYSFKGYFTQPNGVGAKYYDGPNLISVNTWDITANTTLYAFWVPNTYTITLDNGDVDYGKQIETVTVIFGENLKKLQFMVLKNGYIINGYYTQPGGQGTQYYFTETRIYNDYIDDTILNGRTWDIPENATLYANWVKMTYTFSIMCVNENFEILQNTELKFQMGQEFYYSAPTIDGYNYNHCERAYTISYRDYFELYTESSSIYLEIVYYNKYSFKYRLHYTKKTCVAEGSLITLADGSQKAVEDLTGNELLLVWNLYTGQFDTAPILFIDSDPAMMYEIINLYFSDGTHVKVIDEHAFWDFDLNQYVFLRADSAKHIGHWFNKQITDSNGNLMWTKVQLTNVTLSQEITTAWSPVSVGHLCYYVNGMLSMPGATTGLINIFEVNSELMTIDYEQYLEDIEQYGLFTYEEFSTQFNLPELIFEAFNCKYMKVSFAKGLISKEKFALLINQYSAFWS